MWRYLALASAIVIGACIILVALPSSPRRDAASRYASDPHATAGPAQNDVSRATALPVEGDAPWALSALPECFEQRTSRSGSVAFAHALVRGARPVAPGTVLRVADCTVRFARDSATVSRGEDRLRIPPPTRFFVRAGALLVERRDGVRDDVRVYVSQSGPGR